MRLAKNKKAQFYIFAAILLIGYSFTIVQPPSEIKMPLTAFGALRENFIQESNVVINNAIYEESNLSQVYWDFADEFIGFAKTSSPKFRMFYMLQHDGKIDFGNYLEEDVNVTYGSNSFVVQAGDLVSKERMKDLTLRVGDINYDFEIENSAVELKALFKQTKNNEVRIYVKE
ncbi:MAG: hypothetical protein GY861_04425 [bacterium]|nr:hypothetical protein [bacterium]